MKKLLAVFLALFLFGCKTENLGESLSALNSQLEQWGAEEIVIEAPIEAAFISPKNGATNIEGIVPVNFVWKEGVLPLQNHQKARKFLEEHIAIEPEIKGEWKVLGSAGISFVPKDDWKLSTRYSFQFKNSFIEDLEYGFETKRLQLDRLETKNLTGKGALEIHFNQAIDLEKMASHIEVTKGKEALEPVLFDLSYGEKIEEEVTEKLESVVRLVPRDEWEVSGNYEITISEGAFSAEGDLPLEEKIKKSFTALPAFSVESWTLPKTPRDGFNIRFTAEVMPKEVVPFLEFSPPLTESQKEAFTARFEYMDYPTRYFYFASPYGEWYPSESFQVVLKSGVEDRFGRFLQETTEKNFTTNYPDTFDRVYMMRDYSVFSPEAPLEVSFLYAGTVSTASVSFNGASKSFELEASTKEKKPFKLNLKNEFPDIVDTEGKLKAGIYELKIEVPSPDRHHPYRYEAVFFVSDFSVELKELANDNYQVFARSLPPKSETIKNFSVEAFSGDWEKTWHYRTFDSAVNGFEFGMEDDSRLKYLKVVSGDQIGFGSPRFEEGIKTWDAPVSFNQSFYDNTQTGVLFTDRPLYKPAQKVYFKGLLRDLNLVGKNFPLKPVNTDQTQKYKILIFDPSYQKVEELEGVIENGSFTGNFDLPEDWPLGRYEMQFAIEDMIGDYERISQEFWIQEYRKPNFLISTSFDQDQALLNEVITAKVKANYAFGGAIVRKPIVYTVSLFGETPCRFWCWGWQAKQDKLITSGEGLLDENGEFNIPISLKKLELEDIDWNLLTVNTRVEVSPAEVSALEKSLPFFRSNLVLSLDNIPYFFEKEDTYNLKGTIQDLSDEFLKNKKISVRVMKTKWVRNDRKNADGNFYKEWESVDEEVDLLRGKTDENGAFDIEFIAPEKGGEYFFAFEAKDERSRLETVKHHFWIAGNQLERVRHNGQNKIQSLFPDKSAYDLGDNVSIFVPNPEFKISQAHATLERGEVLETLNFDFENNTIDFEIEEWMVPNVFVSVILEGTDESGDPKVKWGSVKIPINDTKHDLTISVLPEKGIYRPGEMAQFEVKTSVEDQGVPAEVSVAVVDQTLLALKARKQLDIMAELVGTLPLGVSTTHTLANFMSASVMTEILEDAEALMARSTVGFGGGGGKGDDFKPRGDFRDTAEFVSALQTDESGVGSFEFKLPDNLTTWNVFAVGSTLENAFGTQTGDFKVTLPLLISEIVPNFFQSGDTVSVGLLVYRDDSEQKSSDITVRLKLPESLKLAHGDLEKVITVEKEARVFFPLEVQALETKTKADFTFEIEDKSTGIADAVMVKRNILPPVQSLSMGTFARVVDTLDLSFLPDERSISSQLTVKISASLAQHLERFVETATKVNYGCAEQQYSWGTTKIYQYLLDKSLEKETQLNLENLATVRDAIDKAFTGQGYAYWAHAEKPSFWVTTQVLEHADVWSEVGVPFDRESLEISANWLRAEMLKPCEENNWYCPSDASRNNAAFALTKYGKVSVNDLSFLTKHAESLEAKIWWMKTAQRVGQLPPALQTTFSNYLEVITQAYTLQDRKAYWSESHKSFYSQDERLTALILEMLMQDGLMEEQYHKIARYLSETNTQYFSGNTAMRVLKTLTDYVETQEVDALGAGFEVLGDEETLLKGTLSDFDQIQKVEMKSDEEELPETLNISTDKVVLADIELSETLLAKDLVENSRGFWLEREIYALEGAVPSEKPAESLELGENYLVKLTLVTPDSHRQVMLEGPIPSGAEIVNFDLDNADKTLSGAVENQNECRWGWCRPTFQHKEFKYDRARFFVDYLPAGTYEVSYIIRTRLPGEFEWLPAKVEEMYYPEIFANTKGRRIEIKEGK